MTKATYRRVSWGLAYNFRELETRTIMAGSMVASRKAWQYNVTRRVTLLRQVGSREGTLPHPQPVFSLMPFHSVWDHTPRDAASHIHSGSSFLTLLRTVMTSMFHHTQLDSLNQDPSSLISDNMQPPS